MDDQRANRKGGGGMKSMKYSRVAHRPMLIAFAIIATAIATMRTSRGQDHPATPARQSTEVADDKPIAPEDVIAIKMRRLQGLGFIDPIEIRFSRTERNAKYILRLSKAMIDCGFLKLRDSYPSPVPGYDGETGIEIRMITKNMREKCVQNFDCKEIDTNATYLFEMLLRGADADMKLRNIQKN